MPKPKPKPNRRKIFARKSENVKKSSSPQDESWFIHVWRPAMAWSYMAICLFDFIIAPTGTSILITFYKSTIPVWRSLTLENGGIIHVAFGAILGVAAWGRTREAVVNTEYSPYGERGSVYTRDDVYIGDRDRRDNDRDRRDNDRDRRDNNRDRVKEKPCDDSDELTDNMHEADREPPRPNK